MAITNTQFKDVELTPLLQRFANAEAEGDVTQAVGLSVRIRDLISASGRTGFKDLEKSLENRCADLMQPSTSSTWLPSENEMKRMDIRQIRTVLVEAIACGNRKVAVFAYNQYSQQMPTHVEGVRQDFKNLRTLICEMGTFATSSNFLKSRFDLAIENSDKRLAQDVYEETQALYLQHGFDYRGALAFMTMKLSGLTREGTHVPDVQQSNSADLPPTGIRNYGNSCYINAILQVLANANIRKPIVARGGATARELEAYLEAQIAEKPISKVSVSQLRNDWSQQDPEETLRTIIQHAQSQVVFEESLLGADGEVVQTHPIYRDDGTAHHAPVMLELTNFVSGSNDFQTMLSENFVNRQAHANGGEVRYTMMNRPESLFVRAQPTYFGGTGRGTNIAGVGDGMTIDEAYTEDGRPIHYELKGVILHKGGSANGGHYVTLVKKDTWYLANDCQIFRWDSAQGAWFDSDGDRVGYRDERIAVDGAWTPEELKGKGYIYQFDKVEEAVPEALPRPCRNLMRVAARATGVIARYAAWGAWVTAKAAFNRILVPTITHLAARARAKKTS